MQLKVGNQLLAPVDSNEYHYKSPSSFNIDIDSKFDLNPMSTEPMDLPDSNQELFFTPAVDQQPNHTFVTNTFDEEFLSFINSTDNNLCEATGFTDIIDNNLMPSQTAPVTNNDTTAIDETDLLAEILGLDTPIPEPEQLLIQPIVANDESELKEKISDTTIKSGSRISISKVKKKKPVKQIFDKIEMEVNDSSLDSTKADEEKVKYDSIGENEDSSDRLLPWEVKSKSKKRKSKYFSK